MRKSPRAIEKTPKPIIMSTDADALLWNSLVIAIVLAAVAAFLQFGV